MRVLGIEGNKLFRSILSNQFDNEGVLYVLKSNGAEALEATKLLVFDFICVSMYLDDMSATEFIQKVRQLPAYKNTPIVLFTSEHDDALIADVLKAGATEVFHREEIDELVVFIKRYNIRYQELHGTILYIEDSIAQQETVKHILESIGLEVQCVTSAEEGWELFRKNHYDLLIVDVVLTGDMSGIRFVNNVRRVCGEQGDTPILAVSAYDEASRRIELLNRGANDYVSKPVLPDELIARVRGLIGQKRAMLQIREEQEKTINRYEYTDGTTQLPNRKMLLQLLEQELARAVKHDHYSALIYLDLDNFKSINDSMGHEVGDQVLRYMVERVNRIKRREDTLASLGGDDFALLVSEVGSTTQAAADFCRNIADRLHRSLFRPFDINGNLIQTGATLGIALFPSQQASSLDVFKQAETAFHQAKKNSITHISFFSRELQKNVERRFTLQMALRKAIHQGKLELYYQPLFDAQRQLCSMEALSRWCFDGDMISPELFIGIAEECGLIHPLGEWVLHTVISQLKEWQQTPLPKSFQGLAFNVSPNQLSSENFSQRLIRALDESGVDHRWLKMEITENCLISNTERASNQLKRLRDSGIGVAIDDFGTGYSSLSYLPQLPVNQLKIDRSFVWRMEDGPENHAIIDTIINMGKALNMSIVAEGVETQEQLSVLTQKGCDYFQGFYLNEPMNSEDAGKLLRELAESTSHPA